MTTIKDQIKKLELDAEIESVDIIPLQKILSKVKIKKKTSKMRQHVIAEIIIPTDVAKTIPEVIASDYRLGLLIMKPKEQTPEVEK